MLSGVYFGVVDPSRGTSLLIFAFIVVVIGGFGSIGGTAVAAVARRARPAVRELLRLERARRPRRRAPARDRAAAQARGAGSEGGRIEPRPAAPACPWLLLAVFAVLPLLSLDIPVIFGGPLDSPGTLGLLALCLIFAGVALTYDLLFGFTGLLSFGHALYFAIGVYLTTIALTKWEWGFWPSRCSSSAVAGILRAARARCVSLRVGGIAFAMVTLAFAQAGQVLVQKNPNGLTGGEEGLGLNFEAIPDFFVGVLNTKHLYWLALGYAAVVFLVVRWAVNSSPGHVWQAIRENERRVEVIGLQPFRFKLLAFVLASFLATAGGVVWLLVLGTGASPQVTTRELHADAPRDGRDRRRRHPVRRAARRLPLHARRPAARRRSRARRGSTICRRCSRRRSRSRSSSSARSSSCSSSSSPAGSRASRTAGGAAAGWSPMEGMQ